MVGNQDDGKGSEVPPQLCEVKTSHLFISFIPESRVSTTGIIFYHVKHSRYNSSPIKLHKKYNIRLALLIISGDVALNPGPVKCPCGGCARPVGKNHRAIYCDSCYFWWHIKCASVSPETYRSLGESDDPWTCKSCDSHILNISASIFDPEMIIEDPSNSSNIKSESPFQELRLLRKTHINKFIVCHLNINSLKGKFCEIYELLSDKIVDLLFISETKLDSSYYDSNFNVPGYKLERRDRDSHGGGLASFIRSDIPARRRKDLESSHLENITYDVTLNKTKWSFICVYKPPSMQDSIFSNHVETLLDKNVAMFDNFMLLGDLNQNLLCDKKGSTLLDLIDIFNLKSLLKSPTCFMKNCTPSLVDVMLTNNSKLCIGTFNFPTGISDCHNLIGTVINNSTPTYEKSKYKYRSFRAVDEQSLNADLECLKEKFKAENCSTNDINALYENFENDLISVIDKHAPMKEAYRRQNNLPYMNKNLKKEIYKKKMYYHKYLKCKTSKNWENYRKTRNNVSNLKRKSLNKYFEERCVGGCKSTDFWNVIKPYLSKKCKSEQPKIILSEEDTLYTDSEKVADIFNTFFVNVAEKIGKDFIFKADEHPSLIKIKQNTVTTSSFQFKPVEETEVEKIIDKFNKKKATGVDSISIKLLKLTKPSIVKPITNLINHSLVTSSFPDRLKEAQVTPLYKKNDPMLKSNYRPVSILPAISKIFEKVLFNQLYNYFNNIFDKYLCAFRKGHGCQTTLLRLVEDWKAALDKNEYVAAILMDLSKAFDCLPHSILLHKLSAYGLSADSVQLLNSYLSNRKQQIKIGKNLSSWAEIRKGVPQGSILGPLLFNIFMNDIFYFIHQGTLYNYADDNTLSHHCLDYDKLVKILEEESNILIDWFHFNCMQANPDKFQAIAVGQRTANRSPVFKVGEAEICCEETVKLLGVDIDFKLNFNTHISNLLKKASQQLNILKRIGKNLTKLNKLTIFYTFIMSNFSYCPLTWHFCSKKNTDKMERIQKRALRFIYEDYDATYEELLARAGLPTLHIRRMRAVAIETFKILNNLSPPVLQDLLKLQERKYNFRYSNILHVPQVNSTGYGKNSFRMAAPTLWNSLPDDFRKTTNFNHFKRLLSSWNGGACACVACRE